jgi:hypothetical protein
MPRKSGTFQSGRPEGDKWGAPGNWFPPLGLAAAHSRDGAIAFVCMDWRHVGELLAAEQAIFSELKNIYVWNKSNARDGERTVPMPAIAAIFPQSIRERP